MHVSDLVLMNKVERNTFGHFRYLPELLGFSVRKIPELTVVNCGLGTSMFNIVSNAPHTVGAIDTVISRIVKEFEGQPFAWWLNPHSLPNNINDKFKAHGFTIDTTEHAMIFDLSKLQGSGHSASALKVEEVVNMRGVGDFAAILSPYDASAEPFYKKLIHPSSSIYEKLFVGYEQNVPVAIGILYLEGDTAGVFSLLTQEDKRGKGYATIMMQHLIHYAKKCGKSYVSLSASSDAGFRIYKRLGFKIVGQFECWEWKG